MGRILIADDHDALRRGLVRALTDAGHEVEEAPNGNAALERLHESYFDVVLSDLKMGGSDGLEVLEDREGAASDDGRDPDDGVRIGHDGRRGDEDRRVRLRAEAVRDRGDGGQDREGARAAADAARARLPPARPARHLRFRSHHRLERRLAARARRGEEGRQEQHHRPHPRRDGHRQGAHRRRDPSQLAACGAQLRQGELRGAAGEPARDASSSVTRRARSPAPTSSASAASSRRTAARCSSTKSAT